MACRDLLLILGDQLDRQSGLFQTASPSQDVIFMAEVREESTHVWSHKARIALFLSAMRHFRDELREAGWQVDYREIGSLETSLAAELDKAIRRFSPQRVRVVEPGDYRVRESLAAACPTLEILPDRHFLCSAEEFRAHANGRKQLRLEYFYRQMRARYGILMEAGSPSGGQWNFDASNRSAFKKEGPGMVPPPVSFPPDGLTRQVLAEVRELFSDHPGELHYFDWPVTPSDAARALDDFLDQRLPFFGAYQDAMWTEEPYLYHARLSAALNLKLIDPLTVIRAAEQRYRQRLAPLEAVEGFIRQILGWREYVRGIYWLFMPEYKLRNELNARLPLPRFYWTGETEMNCLRETIAQTLNYGYAHHIQRLMVTGLFALLLGVNPREVHEWYLAVYVDAVEWVELPNTLGMSQFADGGAMASKPYAASGKYIDRMSNYCSGCRYDPSQSTGEKACPFTTLYWDFLIRHEARLRSNPRMGMQVRNLDSRDAEKKQAIQTQAAALRSAL